MKLNQVNLEMVKKYLTNLVKNYILQFINIIHTKKLTEYKNSFLQTKKIIKLV